MPRRIVINPVNATSALGWFKRSVAQQGGEVGEWFSHPGWGGYILNGKTKNEITGPNIGKFNK